MTGLILRLIAGERIGVLTVIHLPVLAARLGQPGNAERDITPMLQSTVTVRFVCRGADVRVTDLLGDGFASRLLEISVHGNALVDDDFKIRYVNRVGAQVLGVEPMDAVGRMATDFIEVGQDARGTASNVHSAIVNRPDGDRLIEYTIGRLSERDPGLWIITFWDVTTTRQKERHLRAFARTASSVTYGKSVASVLDLVAAEVRAGTGVVACSAMLIDLEKRTIQSGTAGVYPPDYAERVKASWDRGAPLTFIEAMTKRRTVVGQHFRRAVDHDPRFGSFPAWTLPTDWDTNVTAPMIIRGKVLGVITCAYAEGQDPSDDDVAFLNAVADQAAVAVDNALLVSEMEANAALEERHRLARELHDSVCQALFSLTLQARAVELLNARRGPNDHEQLTQGLHEIQELTQGALADMRALILELRPGSVPKEGLLAAIVRHAEAITARAGIPVKVSGPTDRLSIRPDAVNDLFRIAQEALQNVVKHGKATSIDVRLDRGGGTPGGLRMTITDDGVGFDPTARYPGHIGLSTMRERATRLGGNVLIESRPGCTTVNVVVPDVIADEEARL
jgi:signal transduction histidine kinase